MTLTKEQEKELVAMRIANMQRQLFMLDKYFRFLNGSEESEEKNEPNNAD